MKRPGFAEGVVLAVLVSLAVTVVFTVLSGFFPTRWLLQAIIAGVSFSYICYLLIRSQEKTGRLVVIALWSAVSVAAWLFSPSTIVSLFVHIGMIWLIRALYYHASLLVALVDLGMTLFAMAAAIWTLIYTNSLFLSVWCFFLIQAVFVLLPVDLKSRIFVSRHQQGRQSVVKDDPAADTFEQAYLSAQSAVRQLMSNH